MIFICFEVSGCEDYFFVTCKKGLKSWFLKCFFLLLCEDLNFVLLLMSWFGCKQMSFSVSHVMSSLVVYLWLLSWLSSDVPVRFTLMLSSIIYSAGFVNLLWTIGFVCSCVCLATSCCRFRVSVNLLRFFIKGVLLLRLMVCFKSVVVDLPLFRGMLRRLCTCKVRNLAVLVFILPVFRVIFVLFLFFVLGVPLLKFRGFFHDAFNFYYVVFIGFCGMVIAPGHFGTLVLTVSASFSHRSQVMRKGLVFLWEG